MVGGLVGWLVQWSSSLSGGKHQNVSVTEYERTRCTTVAWSLALNFWWRPFTYRSHKLPMKVGTMEYSTCFIVEVYTPYWLWIDLDIRGARSKGLKVVVRRQASEEFTSQVCENPMHCFSPVKEIAYMCIKTLYIFNDTLLTRHVLSMQVRLLWCDLR